MPHGNGEVKETSYHVFDHPIRLVLPEPRRVYRVYPTHDRIQQLGLTLPDSPGSADFMEQDAQPATDQREQRLLAVAKLKRAASLPRMKDGRRPPMHVEGVSEGEQSNSDEDRKLNADAPVSLEDKTEVTGVETEGGNETEDPRSTPSVSRSRRRSRTRTRSRGSRELKNRVQGTPSPNPNALEDSSQDESSQPATAFMPTMIPISTAPSAFMAALHQTRMLRSPTPTGHVFTLEDLGRNYTLLRSNSAAGRMIAMHKLTNGTDVYEPSPSLSPSPTPSAGGKFKRNNTVSGGERNVARKNLLTALAGRVAKDPETEPGSCGEELTSPSPTPTKRKRRRRRSSTTVNNTGQSDSEFVSTSPNTPQVPPTPLPTQELPSELRALSVTPNHAPLSRIRTPELFNIHPEPDLLQSGTPEPSRPEHTRRRSVVVEEDWEERVLSFPQPLASPAPFSLEVPILRDPQYSASSADSGSIMPIYLSGRAAQQLDNLPNSPFTIPYNEKSSQDEEEEEVLYEGNFLRHQQRPPDDREISWDATAVPIWELPPGPSREDIVQEEEYLEEEDHPASPQSSNRASSPVLAAYENSSPRASSSSQNQLTEPDNSPEATPSYSPSSQALLSQAASPAHASDDAASHLVFPARLSVSSRLPSERSPLSPEFPDLEDYSGYQESPSKVGAWEKVKNTFMRSNSSIGRRSRTNSIVARHDRTDSSVSRESGASLTSGKEKPESQNVAQSPRGQQTAPQLIPSASSSYVSLGGTRGTVSPTQLSPNELAKYQNSKLFPFPGIVALQEQLRAKGQHLASASTPDINALLSPSDEEGPQTATSSVNTEPQKDRTLVHQSSDSGLPRFGITSPATPTSQISTPGYFTPPLSPSSLLPTTLPGVKKWLSNKKLFSGQSSSPSNHPPISAPVLDPRYATVDNFKKPSLSDLLRLRKEDGFIGEWDELGSTPTSASGSTLVGRQTANNEAKEVTVAESPTSSPVTVVQHSQLSRNVLANIDHEQVHEPQVMTHPLDPHSSTTPDPNSSLSDYPAQSTSESSSIRSSHRSSFAQPQLQGEAVLQRLEQALSSDSQLWQTAVDEPPRKLLLSTAMLQVVNSNTVKDRLLFLFTDLLVIAKPIIFEDDTMMSRSAMDRKMTVKSIILLRNLKFYGGRPEPTSRVGSSGPRNSLLRTFIQQFEKDPDDAILTLFSTSGVENDPIFLGQLLFKCIDLDRRQLGMYLSRRGSRPVLKSYLSCFALGGLRIDKALRAFLLSLHVPPHDTQAHASLEYLLDAFSSRWYDANAGYVPYDKDSAIRLVRALVQLNDLLHEGLAEDFGPTGDPRHNITSRNFIEAFKRYDKRNAVSEEHLDELYESVRHERLCHARPFTRNAPDVLIALKRPLPARLTYKVQSEPFTIRIPQSDPYLSIELYGQDLVFDPPILKFQRSAEASFRITAGALGSKTLMMRRSGPNALRYYGLPFSSSVTVERAFMRNTFQLAFYNHSLVKRRYMFSVDDPVICHQWEVHLKRQIEISMSSPTASLTSASLGPTKFYRAAEVLAFKALRQTLMGPELQSDLSALQQHQRQEYLHPSNGLLDADSQYSNGRIHGSSAEHIRSKSTSQIYQRLGAGKDEPEMNGLSDVQDNGQSFDTKSPLWTGNELEAQCRQNSVIALVLSYLQVGSPGYTFSS